MNSSETQNNGIIDRKSRKDTRGILEMVMKLWYELYYSRKKVMYFLKLQVKCFQSFT